MTHYMKWQFQWGQNKLITTCSDWIAACSSSVIAMGGSPYCFFGQSCHSLCLTGVCFDWEVILALTQSSFSLPTTWTHACSSATTFLHPWSLPAPAEFCDAWPMALTVMQPFPSMLYKSLISMNTYMPHSYNDWRHLRTLVACVCSVASSPSTYWGADAWNY
jgi:hypothetical protein